VFCFDGDRAGRAAAWRALLATLPCLQDGRDAHFLFLPDGEDPDSVVSSQGAAGFHELLAGRLPIIDFLYQHLEKDVDMDSIGGKAQLAEKAKPLLETIPRGVYKQLALQRLESLIGLSLGSQRAAAQTSARTAIKNGPADLGRDSGRMTTMSRTVLLILQHPSIVGSLPADSFEYSESLAGADVLSQLIGYCTTDQSTTTARLLERFRDTPPHRYLSQLATRPYWPDDRELDVDTAVAELAHCINNLRLRSNKTMTGKVEASARKGLLAIRN
jgi:DNA primase